VRVLQHVTEDIIGIDFINTHHLWYNPVLCEVFFNKTKQTATLSMMSETHLRCLSKVIMKVRYNGDLQKRKAHIATIKSDQSALITGGPALIKIEENNLCYIEIENCSPCDIKLERGSTIATVESEWEDQIQEFDGKQVDNFINESKDTDSKIQKPVYLTREDIKKRVKMNIPTAHKDKYLDLLYKYRNVISKNKSDLGMAKKNFIALFSKTTDQYTESNTKFRKHTQHLSKIH